MNLREHDLDDLYARWFDAIDRLCESPDSEEQARKAHESYEAIRDYCNALEPPVFPGGDGILVRIRKEARA